MSYLKSTFQCWQAARQLLKQKEWIKPQNKVKDKMYSLKWRRHLPLLLFLLCIACEEDEPQDYGVCNSLLLSCAVAEDAPYCTFGYKWGAGNPFSDAGATKPGPALGPVEISYRFMDEGYRFSTHSQQNMESQSFANLASCAKDKIREAIQRWQRKAAITFVEKDDGPSDLKIIVADIKQDGVAFPPFPDAPCSDLAGLVVIRYNVNQPCESFYYLALHEVGHALGLGHVKSNNVMNPDLVFFELQLGDIEGIQSIYGLK